MKEIKFLAACVGLLTVIAVGAVLNVAQNVFMPLLIAWLLSFVVALAVRFLTAHRVPMWLTVFLVIGVLFAIVFGVVTVISDRMSEFIQIVPMYYERLLTIVKDVSSRLSVPPTFWNTIDWGSQLRLRLLQLSGSVFSLSSSTVMVFIFLMFILVGSPYVELKLRRAFADEKSFHRVVGMLATISSQIGRFLGVMALISAVTGLCVWMALSLLKVEFAASWGLLAFALNFIPTVGSIVASIPPILVAVVQFYPGFVLPLATALSLLAIQMLIGNIITPKVMGDRLNLSPVVILLSLLFWGWLWGVMGALLAMPLAAILKIVCENFPSLNVLAVMMGSGKNYSQK